MVLTCMELRVNQHCT